MGWDGVGWDEVGWGLLNIISRLFRVVCVCRCRCVYGGLFRPNREQMTKDMGVVGVVGPGQGMDYSGFITRWEMGGGGTGEGEMLVGDSTGEKKPQEAGEIKVAGRGG